MPVQISETILINAGAIIKHFTKGATIFQEGDTPRFYHQVKAGCVKMSNANVAVRLNLWSLTGFFCGALTDKKKSSPDIFYLFT